MNKNRNNTVSHSQLRQCSAHPRPQLLKMPQLLRCDNPPHLSGRPHQRARERFLGVRPVTGPDVFGNLAPRPGWTCGAYGDLVEGKDARRGTRLPE
jgi:hypothetical protein